jgi:UDP-N-acetylglucosamine--N-acetylmuramyl-(pentapeptide) pyrophosphoryl-undecaprenol N-acetylglucosamine transferase
MKKIIVMAGGTGGHVFPALAVAQALREQGHDVTWLGSPDSFESRLVPQHDFIIDTIDAFRLRGQNKLTLLLAPYRLLRALWQARSVLKQRKPQLALGMGGFAAGPGGLMARWLGIPLVIHEQNALPGLTNRYLARLATRVLQAFPHSFAARYQAEAVGNPVRAEIAALPEPQERLAGRDPAQPLNLLIIGGSQGAQALNETVPQALALLEPAHRPKVRHQAGRGKTDATESAYQQTGVEAQVLEFIHDMPRAYEQADLVICRSGALTVSELAAAGVAAILVPFPFAVDDHQTRNGAYLADANAARLVAQNALTPDRLAELIRELSSDRAQLQQMATKARELAIPGSARRVASICLEVAA